MSDYWDEPVYADVDREARAAWLAERPREDRGDDWEKCDRCGRYVCGEGCA